MDQKQPNNKKILIATGIFPPDIGGPATYVSTLLEELPKFEYEVKVVTYSDETKQNIQNSKFKIQNFQIYRISRKQNILCRYIEYFKKVYSLIGSVDLVYVQGPISEGVPTWLACKLRGKKYILKVVGDYAWESYQNRFKIYDLGFKNEKFIDPETFQSKKFDFKTEILRILERTVARGAEKIITPSVYLKTIVMKWGIKEEKIKVIYNSAPIADISLTKEEARRELGLGGRIMLSVGRLVPWKGFDVLIDLMPELLKVFPDLKLVIVGDGPERKNFEFRISNFELGNNVILTGGVGKEAVMKYMRAADMFVLNTGYEGLSHVIIEAMRMGLPVITTRIGGNPELITNGENGILVEYGSKQDLLKAIITMITNDFKIDNLDNVNARVLSKLTKENMINDLIKEIEVII